MPAKKSPSKQKRRGLNSARNHQRIIKAGRLDLVDSSGNVRAQLTVDEAGTPMLLMLDTKGKRRFQVSALEHSFEGEPVIALYAPDGETVLAEISKDGIQQPEKRTEPQEKAEATSDRDSPAKTYKELMAAIDTRQLFFDDDKPIRELVHGICYQDDDNADRLLLLLNLLSECDGKRIIPKVDDLAGRNMGIIVTMAMDQAIAFSAGAMAHYTELLTEQTERGSDA